MGLFKGTLKSRPESHAHIDCGMNFVFDNGQSVFGFVSGYANHQNEDGTKEPVILVKAEQTSAIPTAYRVANIKGIWCTIVGPNFPHESDRVRQNNRIV